MNNKKTFLLIGVFLGIFFLLGTIKRKIDLNERNQFGVVSVAKIGKFKGASGGKYLDFIYFVEGKMYKNDYNRNDYPHVKKGEFYKIIYSSKNPKNVEIFLDKRITDSTLIDNAGLNLKRKIGDLFN